MIKKAISSVVATYIVLGTTFAPTVFADTSATTTYPVAKKQILFNGTLINSPMSITANDPSTKKATTYMPIWYVLQALKGVGLQYTWDAKGNILNLVPPSTMKVDLSNVKSGTGVMQISINNTVVTTAPKLSAQDPYSHADTTYVPIYYIIQALNRLGVRSVWNGTAGTWNLSLTASPTPPTQQVYTLTVTGNTNVGTGQPDALGVQVTDEKGAVPLKSGDITWSVDKTSDAVVTGNGTFLATKAGVFTVTATYQKSSQTFKVNVYGNTSAIRLAASGNLVANGKSSGTMTVTAVDSDGNTVLNENGTIVISDDKGWLVSGTTNGTNTIANRIIVQFKNGVGSIQLQAPTTPGLSDTITSSNLSDVGQGVSVSYASTSVQSVPQVATSLSIVPQNGQKYLVANQGGNTAGFTVVVNDQSGAPMLTGTYAYNIQVSGAATYNGPTNSVYIGGATPIPFTVASQQGVIGAATVTVTGSNLQTGSLTVQAVVTQNASKLDVNPVIGGSTSFAEGSSAGFTLTGIDPNGYPASFPTTPLFVFVTNSSGQTASNITVNGIQEIPTGIPLGTNQSVTIGDTRSGANAGSYTVTMKDGAGNTWANFPVTETAAASAQLAVVPTDSEVSVSNASTSLTVQYADTYGNPTAATGNSVITLTATGGQGGATINGQDATKGVQVQLDSTGKAVATFVAQPYAGSTWNIVATNGSTASQPQTVSVLNALVSSALVSLKDITNGGSVTQAQAGDAINLTFDALDNYSNHYFGNDKFTVSYPTGALTGVFNSVTNGGATTVTDTLSGLASDFRSATAALAGNLVVTIQDQNIRSSRSGTASMAVIPGPFAGFGIFDTQNRKITSDSPLAVTANTPVQVWVRPQDTYGNAVPVATVAYTVDLLDGGKNGNFRQSPTSANEQTITFPVGASAEPVYYVNTTGNYVLSAFASNLVPFPQQCSVTVGAFTPLASTRSGSGQLTVVLRDENGVPLTGQASTLTAVASAAGVTVGPFTENPSVPGTYVASISSTATNQGVTVTVKQGTTTIGTSAGFNS